MNAALLGQLRADLTRASYHADAVRTLLGQTADDARQRGVFAPAQRTLAELEATPLAILVQLFLLGAAIPTTALDAALPTLGSAGAEALGLIDVNEDRGVALLSLNPVLLSTDGSGEASQQWWVLSDLDDQLRRGPARPDHVMGVGGATRSLISQLPWGDRSFRSSTFRALDLGTGCGIVALCLARSGAAQVVASDISERALRFARANAILNACAERIEFRQGDLFAAVAGERFDLIASNPPFVITPRSADTAGARYEYRDGGLTGDELAERVVRTAAAHLTETGTLVCLANWESRWGASGLDRVRGWIAAADQEFGTLAAWVIERERLDPARYAEVWIRDGGTLPGSSEFDRLLTAWLDDFQSRRVTGVGLGSIRIRRAATLPQPESAELLVRTEHAPDPFVPDRLGLLLSETFSTAIAVAAMPDDTILASHWLRAAAVDEVREHRPGEEAPRALWLRTDRPLARSVQSDSLLTAAVGACDGELSLAQIADALATILEVDPGACAEALTTGVRELVWLGMLAPATR